MLNDLPIIWMGAPKKVWPTSPIKVGHHVIQNVAHVKVEEEGLEELNLMKVSF